MIVGVRLFVIAALASACSLRDPPTPKRAAPLPADPVTELGTAEAECDRLVNALTAYKECPNHEPADRQGIEGWLDAARRSFEAQRKVKLDNESQKAIATACRRASRSVETASERCKIGPRPKFGVVAP